MSTFLNSFFGDIEKKLLMAGINKKPEEYINNAKIYSIGIGVVLSIIIFFIFLFLWTRTQNNILIIFGAIFSVIFGIIGFFIGLLFFSIYPNILIDDRKRKIDNSLYLASIYMASLASAGTNPLELFRLLSLYKEFSEVQKEASMIIYLVEIVGLSLPVALKIRSEHSPSKEWADLLNGIRTIIVEGGDLERYLYEKSEKYIEDFKRKIIEYSNNLQVFLEIYITLITLGIIFLVIITTLLGSIAGTNVSSIQSLQLLSIFVILPVGTAIFVVLLKAMSPFET